MASRSSNPVQASHPLNPTIQPFSMRARRRGIVGEFDRYFGSVNNLENWQRLCQDVGVDGDHSSITKCREALKTVWVSIYDLLDAVQRNVKPRRFQSKQALVNYTRKNWRYYPLAEAKEGGPVKALLVHMSEGKGR